MKADRSGDGNTSSPRTFEQSLAELEAVVRILEDGQIGLDESLTKYEEGVRLLKACRESLQNAERKIMLLTGINESGNPVTQPFSEEPTSLEEKRESRGRRRSRTSSAAKPCDDTVENGEGLEGGIETDRQKGLF
jgi:exodeoxyribonuclease VII small subunit